MSRSRAWCFTLNNYSSDDIALLLGKVEDGFFRYVTFGEEVGENGTPHLQGFAYFADAKSMSAIIKKLRGLSHPAHWEKMVSTPDKCIAYCHKGTGTSDAPAEAVIHEAGVRPAQGVDCRFARVRSLVRDHADDDDLIDQGFGQLVAQYPAFISSLRARAAVRALQYIPIRNLRAWQTSVLRHMFAPYAFDRDGTLVHMPKFLKQSSFRIPNPRSREIIWIWSSASETGKTTFMDSISRSCPGAVANIGTFKINDILQPSLICASTRVLWFNLTRQATDEYIKYLYVTLETLSDRGLQSSGKYGGYMVNLDPCFIVVTANIPANHAVMPARMVDICVDDHVAFIEPAWRDEPVVAVPLAEHIGSPAPPSLTPPVPVTQSFCTPQVIAVSDDEPMFLEDIPLTPPTTTVTSPPRAPKKRRLAVSDDEVCPLFPYPHGGGDCSDDECAQRQDSF